MNSKSSRRPLVLLAVFLSFSAYEAVASDRSAESFRSAPRSDKVVELPRQLPDAGELMPLHEIAMISRLCANPELQTRIGKSRDDCAKAMYRVRKECTKVYHDKFPRADNAEVDGRMSYQRFANAYMQCLKDRYAKLVINDSTK